jgi:hypothetical protein
MADYSRSYTKEVKTCGDMKLQAGSDIDIICLRNLTAEIDNDIHLRAGGIMKLYDSTEPNGLALGDLRQEVVVKEVFFNNGVSAGSNNSRLDAFEQTFTGTHTRDFLEIWFDFYIQDTAGSDALAWTLNLYTQEDGGGYSLRRAYAINLSEVNNGTTGITPSYSLPISGYYVENIGIATVDTRLVQSSGGQGEILNSASSFRMRHSTKYYDFETESSGTWVPNT